MDNLWKLPELLEYVAMQGLDQHIVSLNNPACNK